MYADRTKYTGRPLVENPWCEQGGTQYVSVSVEQARAEVFNLQHYQHTTSYLTRLALKYV